MRLEKEIRRMVSYMLRSLLSNAPEYADNAAALAGGLKVGDVYRTGDALKVVH